MISVIGVQFRRAGKVYYFAPGGLDIKKGDNVIVETARGVEYGKVVLGVKEVDEDKIIQPLKSVIRRKMRIQMQKTVRRKRKHLISVLKR